MSTCLIHLVFISGLMACGSTYPCPLCVAKKNLLDKIGDPRLWSDIIQYCERWLTEGGEEEDTRKDYFCCHHQPCLGPTTATEVSQMVVPPPLHMELLLNVQLKNLYHRWNGMALWLKSIKVNHVAYHGGNELGK